MLPDSGCHHPLVDVCIIIEQQHYCKATIVAHCVNCSCSLSSANAVVCYYYYCCCGDRCGGEQVL